MIAPQFHAFLIAEGAKWIRQQNTSLRRSSRVLPDTLRHQLQPYFGDIILGKVGYCVLPNVENPPFYSELARMGVDNPIDLTQMLGITFDDIVVLAESMVGDAEEGRLLFHELVHVTQYHFLGIDGFMERYVRGWAENGFDYFSIPLEVEAYELDRRYTRGHRFSVYDQLARKYAAS